MQKPERLWKFRFQIRSGPISWNAQNGTLFLRWALSFGGFSQALFLGKIFCSGFCWVLISPFMERWFSVFYVPSVLLNSAHNFLPLKSNKQELKEDR